MQTQAATPVDEIQIRLFDVIGGEDPGELAPLVEAQLGVAERELKAIPERAQARGADFLAEAAGPLGELVAQFEAYHKWLGELRTALEEGRQSTYVRLHEEAQDLVPGLFAAIERYSKLYASFGAYASPWSNTLASIAQAILAGQAPESNWDDSLASFEQSLRAKVTEVRSVALPGRTACVAAYEQALEAVHKLGESPSLQASDLEPALLDLEEGTLMGERLERLVREGIEGPAAMPVTNVVLAATRQALDGQLETGTAISFLDDYSDMLDKCWDDFERSVSRPSNSALVQQEIPKALQQGDEHGAAVEALRSALKAGNPSAAQSAIEQLMETAAGLAESRQVFETATQHQVSAVCPGCGRANPPENRRCEACGNVLPTEAGAGGSSTFNVLAGPATEETMELGMTENVAKLFRAVDEVAEGHITPEQFEAAVREAQAGLTDFSNELEEIALEMADESQMPEDMIEVWRETHLPYVQEVGAHFMAGLNEVESGLADMLEYVGNPDKEFLIQGVRQVWDGLGMIHRARLAMNSNLQMFQDLLQEAREAGLLGEAEDEGEE